MPETILVPTDGSTHAEKAVALAAELARLRGARLHLFHVLLRDKEPADLRKLAELDGLSPELLEQLVQLEAVPADASVPEWTYAMDPGAVPNAVPDEVLREVEGRRRDHPRPRGRTSGRADRRGGPAGARGDYRHGPPRPARYRCDHLRQRLQRVEPPGRVQRGDDQVMPGREPGNPSAKRPGTSRSPAVSKSPVLLGCWDQPPLWPVQPP